MTTRNIYLTQKTLTSKATIKSIKDILPEAKAAQKSYVAGIGYVLYIKDSAGKVIAHASKTNFKAAAGAGQIHLSVKA